MESNVAPNITRSSDSFSTVPPMVNGGDWGCIVRDLETIIVLVLLAFNFIPQRSHHSPTLPRSRIRLSATSCYSNAWGWNNSHQHNRSAYFPGCKKLRSVQRNNNRPKTLPCSIPETTSTSLLRQPSTITYCDWFDRNCVSIDNTEPPIHREQSMYREFPHG